MSGQNELWVDHLEVDYILMTDRPLSDLNDEIDIFVRTPQYRELTIPETLDNLDVLYNVGSILIPVLDDIFDIRLNE